MKKKIATLPYFFNSSAKLLKFGIGFTGNKLILSERDFRDLISNMDRIKHFIEWKVFGVCSAIGERMGIATTTIRKYFIYLSFATIGSPVIVYFFLAFWMNVKRYVVNARRNPVRYL